MSQVDYRARLQPKNINQADDILGKRVNTNLLYPLYSTNGILFPYTPSVSTGYAAEYDPTSFIHSIYGYNAYIRSYPKTISIDAEFTAQTNDEALYLLAVIHFFRSITKSYFGVNPYNKAGTPPPTLIFSYLGDHQFNRTPVVIKNVDYTYEANIDYVPVNTSNLTGYSTNMGVSLPKSDQDTGYSYVPTHMTFKIELDTQYIPIKLRNEFNLDDFREGRLMGKGYI